MRSMIENQIRLTLSTPPALAVEHDERRATYVASLLMYEDLLAAARGHGRAEVLRVGVMIPAVVVLPAEAPVDGEEPLEGRIEFSADFCCHSAEPTEAGTGDPASWSMR